MIERVPPWLRRWAFYLGVGVGIAFAIAYGPQLGMDSKASVLREQLTRARTEIAELEVKNAASLREIEALRNDVGTIEDRARDELGLVYPGEIVFWVSRQEPR